MFKIIDLTLIGVKNEKFVYKFDSTINYYIGANNTGKTVFFEFIDYMLGASFDISKKEWFRTSLKCATLSIVSHEIHFELRRTLDVDENYIKYADEEWTNSIPLTEYKERLGAIITPDTDGLHRFRSIIGEDLTFRAFTLFNFLGEKALGNTIDFFDRGKDIKYSTKLPLILNYLFNPNLQDILALKQELASLQRELTELDARKIRIDYISQTVNGQLSILNIDKVFDGKNRDVILSEISKLKSLQSEAKQPKNSKSFVELESIYSNVSDQIKIYESSVSDNKRFLIESKNKERMLVALESLAVNKPHLKYLAAGIQQLLEEVKNSVSFNSYAIESNTIKELKKQLALVRNEIKKSTARIQVFDATDKTKSINVIEVMLSENTSFESIEWAKKRARIVEIRTNLKLIQGMDDDAVINSISRDITDLYSAAKEVSQVVAIDCSRPGFKIQYFKKGNLLQPQTIIATETEKYENYYTGSMARQTLIQLCGYLAFIRLLLTAKNIPVIPILVIDHISKPFDLSNRKAIGAILEKFFSFQEAKGCQIFMYDDESPSDLSVTIGKFENLSSETKTGFNPFYTP